VDIGFVNGIRGMADRKDVGESKEEERSDNAHLRTHERRKRRH
jgi:hypothetical protein